MDLPQLSLSAGLRASGMTLEEAWLRQLSLGGDLDMLEVEAYIRGVLRPDAYHHDLLAQALNEYFMDHGGQHPVAYFDDPV